ncbi:MAG: hypothetical protein C0399_10840, partial [Syntrophus sp. (in: bacteria)]|nr:hypothetical protein [Syntrophus sp. (in: bacteria)]
MKKLRGLVAPFTKGVSKKIVLLLFLFGIAPLVLLSTIFLVFYIEQELEHIQNIQKEIVERISSDISSHIEGRLNSLRLFASVSHVRNIDKAKQDMLTSSLLDMEKAVDALTIADLQGKVISKISRYYSFTASEFGSIIKDESFLAARNGKTQISQIEVSPLSNLPQIIVTLPIRDMSTNEVAGVLQAAVNVGKMWELISSYRIGEERYVYIVDHDGYLIIYKDIAAVLKKRDLKHITIVKNLLNDKTGIFRYSGLNGDHVIGASVAIPSLHWGVIVEEPVRTAYKWLYIFSLCVVFVLVLTVSFAVIIGMRFSFQFIVDPIKRLQEGAKAIAGGEFDKKIAIEGTDELSQLAHSFNVMTDNLQTTTVSRNRLVEEIEERKRAETELLKLAAVVERSSELINLATLDGKMIFLNEAGRKMLGIPPGDIGKYSIMEVVPDELKPKVENELLPALLGKDRWEGELQYRNLVTNTLVGVYVMAFTIRNADGKPLYLANVSLDITERKQVEEALKESEAKYRSIFENAIMGIFRTTPDGHYLSINPAGAKMYHYTSEEDMRQSVTDMAHQIYVHPEDRKQLKELLEINGFVEGFEAPHYTKDRSTIWVSLNVRVIHDNSGAILYYETTSQDITSRKLAEEEITSERS